MHTINGFAKQYNDYIFFNGEDDARRVQNIITNLVDNPDNLDSYTQTPENDDERAVVSYAWELMDRAVSIFGGDFIVMAADRIKEAMTGELSKA